MITTPTTTRPKPPALFRLPDPPEREPDEKMANADALHELGQMLHLFRHFGRPESTLVKTDRFVTTGSGVELPSGSTRRVPDLLIAFGVDPEAYVASNGYVIEEQGKPPDFVLEVASQSTASEDIGPKRADYAAMGIAEYWRFDKAGEHHGARLAGDRLVGGVYVPIDLEEQPDGALEGYSEAIDLRLRWEDGALGWHDPSTGRHIATFDRERDRADSAEALLATERDRADSESDRADRERDRADSAEARNRELEAELRRLRGG